MNIIDRAKEIIMHPRTAWERIRGENTAVRELYTSYAAILAAIPAAATVFGLLLFRAPQSGFYYDFSVTSILVYTALQYVMTLVCMHVIAVVIDALAPRFNSRKNMTAAQKVAVYSWTPALVAGALAIVPVLTPLILLSSLYSLYVFYIGLPILMETPKERAVGYFAVVLVASIVVWVTAGALSALVIHTTSMP
jgi:hypothetical protein